MIASTNSPRSPRRADNLGEVLSSVQLPLENIEYTLDQYLLEHGQRLDVETRMLLATIRDSIGRVAVTTRRFTETADGPARQVRSVA